MSDNLQIVVDTERAQKGLDALGAASDRLIQKLAQLNGTTNLDKILASINAIDTASSKSSGQGFKTLQDAINKLDVTKLSAAASQLSSLSNINLHSTATSVGALQASINGINSSALNTAASSLGGVAAAARTSAGNFDSFATAVRNAVGQVGGMTANASTMAGAFFSAGGSVSGLVNQLSALLGVSQGVAAGMLALGSVVVFKQLAQQAGELAVALATPAVQIDRFKSSIDAIAGSGAGAKAFAELNTITKQVGGNVGAMLDPFQKFVIAAKSAGVEMQTSVNVFRGFQTGLTATGATAQQTERVFNALQQMMAKGTVQAEELKGQLGDSMAGALDIASKSMGLTTKELLKLGENGKVMSSDLLPKMARELENTFGSAARARMQGFTGQLDAMRNNVFSLTAAFGTGGLGGAVSGFAAFMRQINTALTMPGLDGFVKLLGDLTGALVTLAGSALAGVVQGLAAMASAVGAIYNALTNGLSALGNWLSSLGSVGQAIVAVTTGFGGFVAGAVSLAAASATVLGTLRLLAATTLGTTVAGWVSALVPFAAKLYATATAATAAAGGLTGLAAATAGGLITSLRTAATAAGTFAVSLTSWAGISAAATAAVTVLKGAVARLSAVLLANPFVAAATAAAALFVALKQFGVLDEVADKFTKASTAAEAAKNSMTLVSDAAERLSLRVKSGAETIYDAATKFSTYAEMSERAKRASQDMEEAQKNLTRSTAEQSRQLKEQEISEKSYQESIKASTEALRYKIDREKEAKATNQELGRVVDQHLSSLEKSNGLTKQAGDTSSQTAAAIKQNSYAYDTSAAAIANYSAKIKDNEAAMRASESSLAAKKAKQEELTLATQRSAEEIERAQESIKKYGVVLDSTQQSLVSIVERTGKHREEAAQLAVQISNLVRTQGEWQQKLAEEIALNDKKIAANQELVAILQREKAAIDAKVASGQKLTDLDKLMLDRLNAAIAARNKDISTSLDEKMAQEALSLAKEKDIDLTKAATEVAGRYKEATKGAADAAKIAADAINVASGANDKAKASTDSVAEAAKKAADESKRQADVQQGVATNMEKTSGILGIVSGAWDKLTTSLGTATERLTPIEAQLQSTAAAINSMGQNVQPLATALPQVAAGFATMQEPLTSLSTTIEPVSAAFTSMASSLPPVTLALTQMKDAVTLMVEPLPQLVEPLNAIKAAIEIMSPLMPPLGEGFMVLSQSFPMLAESGPLVASAFQSIGASIDKIKEMPVAVAALNTAMIDLGTQADALIEKTGAMNERLKEALDTFMKSKEATDAFGDNMASVRDAIDSTISKFDELIRKAREAAQAMSGASSGGAGDNIAAGSQRLGGMSGAAPQSASVSASMFASAPKLAEGIANTNDLVKRGGGGFPTILHPNEAVVPLPRNRSIPVEMKVAGGAELQMATAAAQKTLTALGDIDLSQIVEATSRLGATVSPREALGGRGAVGVGRQAPTPLKETAAVDDARAARNRVAVGGRVDTTVNPNGGGAITVNMTVNAKDADSFKKSQGQIQSELFRQISRQASKDR